jgi:Dyp-type peroxidase family
MTVVSRPPVPTPTAQPRTRPVASSSLKDQLADVQGIIVRGYVDLPGACFVLLAVRDAAAARRWLGGLSLTDGTVRPTERAVNVAFTYAGLLALGLPADIAAGFSEEFIQGMAAPPRRLALGDSGTNAPEAWRWGGPKTPAVDVLLMLYAASEAGIDDLYASAAAGFDAGGVEQIGEPLRSMTVVDEATQCVKEHFGFCDALSQPFIEGLEKPAPDFLTVKTGEIILGYPNEYGKYTERPLVPAEQDPSTILPDDVGGSPAHDLGRNGTYLVFRQMSQDPRGFWRFVEAMTRDATGLSTRDARIRLASKMVGRWPSGAPLALAPDEDAPELRLDNTFLYHESDPSGMKCPLGSHIRRTNPRDSLGPEPGTDKSIAVNKRHQILRRGRMYGPPAAPSMDPDDLMNGDTAGDRGLFFIALNANVSRQFEFVQQSWVNNPKFAGLYEDPDPLIGVRDPKQKGRRAVFTVPAQPVRRRTVGLPEFVTVRGGAYVFLPGLSAVRYLASRT